MQLTDRPRFFPEVTITGRTEGPVLDTEIDHPGGRLYVDRFEATLIAQPFGFLTPEDARRLQLRETQLLEHIRELEARLQRIGRVVGDEVLAV